MLAEARQVAGLDDFGTGDIGTGLALLAETYRTNGFDEGGLRRQHGRLVGRLAERLRIEDALARHPEIRSVDIGAPVYLTGLPRTGTSALLNLLATDPAMRPMALWEGMHPSPLPGKPPKDEDPRYVAMRDAIAAMYEHHPGFEAIHHTTADTPEECVHLLNHTFADVQYGIEVLMEPYASWFRAQDHRPAYRYYADLLRMLQWQRPGERLLLKSPAHLWALDILAELFPDCALVITHRDPVECVGSYASMMESLMAGRSVDRHALGEATLAYLVAKTAHARASRAALDPARVLDVAYTDLVADPVATVGAIYDHFGLPRSAGLDATWAAHVAAHPQGEHGTHDYRLDDYGLDPDGIRARFDEAGVA